MYYKTYNESVFIIAVELLQIIYLSIDYTCLRG